MKVCYICNEYPEGPHGGIGTVVKLLAEEIVNMGHQAIVIGVYDRSYPSASFEKKNNVEVYRLKVDLKNRFESFLGYYKMSRILRRWITEGKVDIIEVPDSYGMISIFKSFRAPLVLRAHGNNTYISSVLGTLLKKKTKWYEKNLYKKADDYCAVSAYTADRMRLLYGIDANITVIYNGIDIENADDIIIEKSVSEEFSTLTNPLVFSGTLNRMKGIFELVNAILNLLQQKIEVTLIINGKDSVNQQTGTSVKQELIEGIPLEYRKYFIFKGHVKRETLFQQYKLAKAAVFPSYVEAFAMAPLEAMAMGIPTLFSDKCSGKEAIDHLKDGLLIKPDNESSIVWAIKWVLQNPDEALKVGLKGKEKVEQYFTKQIMVKNSINFYKHAIYNQKRRRNR